MLLINLTQFNFWVAGNTGLCMECDYKSFIMIMMFESLFDLHYKNCTQIFNIIGLLLSTVSS